MLTGTARGLQSPASDARSALPQDNDAAAALIAGGRLDVLVDLADPEAGHRWHVLGRKPATVQVMWLADVDTSGADATGYMLPDAIHTPAGEVRVLATMGPRRATDGAPPEIAS